MTEETPELPPYLLEAAPTGLKYSSADNDTVDMMVHFAHGAVFRTVDFPIPFTASATDPHFHGRDLYARAQAGEFGAIEDYTPPQE